MKLTNNQIFKLYESLNILKEIYEPFVYKEDVVAIAIGTRADCLDDDVVEYLASIASRKDLWVEIGLQSAHDETAKWINRGYYYDTFVTAVNNLRKHNINVTVHIINGLPNETKEMMIETVKYLSTLDIQGIKIHMLSILKDTPIEYMYQRDKFHILTKEEYIDITISQLELLRPEIVIHRITGDPKLEDLIEPQWLVKKFCVLNDIDKEMVKRDTYQGSKLWFI